VITVDPPRENVEAEVDLGGRAGREGPVEQRRAYPPFFFNST
jgi:hypothetical protein